jgi:hypothetical protein
MRTKCNTHNNIPQMQTKLTLALRPCSHIKMAMTAVAPTIATRTTTELMDA